MTMPAEVIWPERESLYDLMLLRATMGQSAFAAEKQCDPVDPTACEWPPELFDRGDLYFDEWPSDLLVRTLALDPSKGKDARRGDYSAIIRFGRRGDGSEYVEADLARRTAVQMCVDLVEHARVFSPDGVGVETNQFQELLLIPLETAARQAGLDLPVYRIDNTVNKMVRIRRLTQPLTQRRLRFRRGSPGTELLLAQMRDWPWGEHDDGPDALEIARRLAIELCVKRKGKR